MLIEVEADSLAETDWLVLNEVEALALALVETDWLPLNEAEADSLVETD